MTFVSKTGAGIVGDGRIGAGRDPTIEAVPAARRIPAAQHAVHADRPDGCILREQAERRAVNGGSRRHGKRAEDVIEAQQPLGLRITAVALRLQVNHGRRQ